MRQPDSVGFGSPVWLVWCPGDGFDDGDCNGIRSNVADASLYAARARLDSHHRTSRGVQREPQLTRVDVDDGDKRKFPIVLVVPEGAALRNWAKERNLASDDVHALLQLADVTAKIEREVMVNLRDLASYQIPKKVVIVEDDFTVENGALTPSMKVKRHVVEERYREKIDACYE